MSLIAAMLFGLADGPSLPAPDDDYWYTAFAGAGMVVTPDTAKRVATVYACERVIKEAIASLPCIVYRKLKNGGKERASGHPLYHILHSRPNARQTAFEYWEMNAGFIELRGNAYSLIIGGATGAIEQLVPLHPDRVQVVVLANGRMQYLYKDRKGIDHPYSQEDVFHLRGASSDGYIGMSPITVNRETISHAMAAQDYGARYFQNDATPSGVLKHPGELSEEAQKRLRDSLQKSQTGSNRHKTMILEEGMEFVHIGASNKDSQFLELRKYSRSEICSIFGVPPHMIGDLERATFSNIEQQSLEFGKYCIGPRLKRIESRINNDLLDALEIGEPGEYFCEFLMDALLRGDLASRYTAYNTGINAGFITRNEAREKENMNPLDGLDEPLTPLNMAKGSDPEPSGTQRALPPGKDDGEEEASVSRVEVFARSAAERMVRKEISALRRLRAKGATCADVEAFYDGHAPILAAALHINEEAAWTYAHSNLGALDTVWTVAGAVDPVLTGWEQTAVEVLVDLALKELK